MPVSKLVLNGSQFQLNPGSTPNPVIDFASILKEWSIQPKRASINTSAHGDLADSFDKGGGQHMLTLNFFYPQALSTIMPALLTELNNNNATPFAASYAPGTTPAVNNPQITGAISVHDLGKWGGARNTAMETSVTLPVNGQLSYNDGTTTVTF